MRGRFSGSGLRPGCGLRSRARLGRWLAAAIRLPLPRAWCKALVRSTTPVADRSAFHCAGPRNPNALLAQPLFQQLESAASLLLDGEVAPMQFATAKFARCSTSRCAPVDRAAAIKGSSILREVLEMCERFLCAFAIPVALLGLLHIQSVHKHRQLLRPHRHTALACPLPASENDPSPNASRTPTIRCRPTPALSIASSFYW